MANYGIGDYGTGAYGVGASGYGIGVYGIGAYGVGSDGPALSGSVALSGTGSLAATGGVPQPPPDPAVSNRWVLTDVDTSEFWVMPINPNSMSSPHLDRQLSTVYGTKAVSGVGGFEGVRSFRTPSPAKEWSFGGVIRTKAHYEALEAWSKKPGKVHVTDHLGRTFEVIIQSFSPEDRKPTPSVSWRLNYTMSTLLLRRVS